MPDYTLTTNKIPSIENQKEMFYKDYLSCKWHVEAVSQCFLNSRFWKLFTSLTVSGELRRLPHSSPLLSQLLASLYLCCPAFSSVLSCLDYFENHLMALVERKQCLLCAPLLSLSSYLIFPALSGQSVFNDPQPPYFLCSAEIS